MLAGLLLLLLATEVEPIDSDRAALEYCEQFESHPLPSFLTQPDATEDQSECLKLYYGIGRDRDRRAGARCCVATARCTAYAAMAFANGAGVKRSYATAARLLCRARREIAPAEWWSMLDHLQRMQSGEVKKDLDFCEHVTSGRGAAFCSWLTWARESPQLEKRLDRVRAALQPEAAKRFDALRIAAQQFMNDEGMRTGDDARGGTLYRSYVIGGQAAAESAFVELVERYSKKRARPTADSELADAEKALMAAETAVKTADPECVDCVEHFRAAHKSWIALRDAFVDYYAARWRGAAPADALRREIQARLTVERLAEIRRR